MMEIAGTIFFIIWSTLGLGIMFDIVMDLYKRFFK